MPIHHFSSWILVGTPYRLQRLWRIFWVLWTQTFFSNAKRSPFEAISLLHFGVQILQRMPIHKGLHRKKSGEVHEQKRFNALAHRLSGENKIKCSFPVLVQINHQHVRDHHQQKKNKKLKEEGTANIVWKHGRYTGLDHGRSWTMLYKHYDHTY